MPRLATIGVYGFSAETFLAALRDAGVTRIVDVRQRRGVRGSEYAWANARRLQDTLDAAGIEYEHRRDLAPTTDLRQLQYRADDAAGVGKRSRTQLAAEYTERYLREILDGADVGSLIADGGLPALLCVERDPEACHRSLIADRAAHEHGAQITHLTPI